jgi:Asp/Glu/hydantoin racemase
MKRASAIKVVLSCTGLAGEKKKIKKRKQIPILFFL